MILVGADNGTSTGHLGTDELGLDALTRGDEGHLFGDDALFGKVHLGVTFVLALAGVDPFGSDFGQTFLGVAVARSGGVVEVEMLAVGEVDATEGDLEGVGVVLDGFVFLGRFTVMFDDELERDDQVLVIQSDLQIKKWNSRKGVVVRHTLNPLKLWIEGINGGLGTFHTLDVCLFGNQILSRIRDDT